MEEGGQKERRNSIHVFIVAGSLFAAAACCALSHPGLPVISGFRAIKKKEGGTANVGEWVILWPTRGRKKGTPKKLYKLSLS